MKFNFCLLLVLLLITSAQKATPAKAVKHDETLSEDFIIAIRNGDSREALRLLSRGADIEWRDADFGMTGLMWAAANGDLQLVQTLLKRGADIKARDDMGSNALQSTVDATTFGQVLPENYLSVVKLLLQQGIDVNTQTSFGQTPLLQVARAGDVPALRLLLSYHARANDAYKNGITALMIASENGHAEFVKTLLDAGADVRAKDKTNKTALNWLDGPIVIMSSYTADGDGNKGLESNQKRFEATVKKIAEGRHEVKKLLLKALAQTPVKQRGK